MNIYVFFIFTYARSLFSFFFSFFLFCFPRLSVIQLYNLVALGAGIRGSEVDTSVRI